MPAPPARILVLDDERPHDVFEVLGIEGKIARVRSPFLFEIGEELVVRIEEAGAISDGLVRVRTHVGTADARITWLEIVQRSPPRRPES